MTQHLGALALIVHDYDEAIHFYVETLGFILAEDTDLGGGKRWVRVTPPGGMETSLLLAKAVTIKPAGACFSSCTPRTSPAMSSA